MPTVELDIRQLADEGGTAPLAPITVTDAVLDEDGNTLTDILSELNNRLTSYITTQTFIETGVSVSAGTVSDYTFSITKTGYTPLGIVGVIVNAGGSCTLVHAFVNSISQAKVRLRNNGTTGASPDNVQIIVLYVKNAI